MSSYRFKGAVALCAAAVWMAAPSAASASNILTWGFTDLSGSFNAGAGLFQAVSVSNDAFRTDGDVTRLAAPGGTAQYRNGAQAGAVQIALTVQNAVGGTATGAGLFSITDADGDTLSGLIAGMWISPGAGITYFNGILSGVQFAALPGHTTFDGPSGGAFGMNLPGSPPYSGAVVELFINPAGGFFDQSFEHISTQASAVVTPAPGAMALLGLAGIGGLRRRRR
jgi:MYXO-CTERM domain-containing protein